MSKEDYRTYERSTCCFCGDECNASSQSCGRCSRNISGYSIGLVSELPHHLKDVFVDNKHNKRTTSRVCLKVTNIRPKYSNVREWLANKNNLYVGRKFRLFIDKKIFFMPESVWKNPFKIPKDGNLDEVLVKYKIHLEKLLKTKNLEELKGKNLGCYCDMNKKCHVDILLEFLNK